VVGGGHCAGRREKQTEDVERSVHSHFLAAKSLAEGH
jgi:hypothetical protein